VQRRTRIAQIHYEENSCWFVSSEKSVETTDRFFMSREKSIDDCKANCKPLLVEVVY
jgi:hypothetical protein